MRRTLDLSRFDDAYEHHVIRRRFNEEPEYYPRYRSRYQGLLEIFCEEVDSVPKPVLDVGNCLLWNGSKCSNYLEDVRTGAAPPGEAASAAAGGRQTRGLPTMDTARLSLWRSTTRALVFPSEPLLIKDARRGPGAAGAIGILALATFLFVGRQSGVGALDTLWAEDGTIFLQTSLDSGFLGSLAKPYAGYLHAFPRLVAEAVLWLPPRWWSEGMSGAGALAGAALALFVFTASKAQLRVTRVRGALALGMLLLPAAGIETTIAACNTHWYLIFASFWALLWRPPGAGGILCATVVVLLGVLSDPFVVLFAPIVLLRLLALPRWREQVVSIAFVLGAAAQLIAIATNPEPRPFELLDGPRGLAFWYDYHVIQAAVFGIRLRDVLVEHFGQVLLGLVAVALLGVAFLPARRLAREQLPFLALCSVYFVVLYAVPVVLAGFSTPRYSINPLLLLLTMVGYVVANAGPRLVRGARVTLEGGIALVLITQWTLDYAPENPRSPGPSWTAELARAQEACKKGEMERPEFLLAPLPEQQRDAQGAGATRRWTLAVECPRLVPAAAAEAGAGAWLAPPSRGAEGLPVEVRAHDLPLPQRNGGPLRRCCSPGPSRPSCPRVSLSQRFGYAFPACAAPVTFLYPEDTHQT